MFCGRELCAAVGRVVPQHQVLVCRSNESISGDGEEFLEDQRVAHLCHHYAHLTVCDSGEDKTAIHPQCPIAAHEFVDGLEEQLLSSGSGRLLLILACESEHGHACTVFQE